MVASIIPPFAALAMMTIKVVQNNMLRKKYYETEQ